MNAEIKIRPHHFAKKVLGISLVGYTTDHTNLVQAHFDRIQTLPPETKLSFVISTDNSICQSCPKNVPPGKPYEEYTSGVESKLSKPCFPDRIAHYDSIILEAIEEVFEKSEGFTVSDILVQLSREKEHILFQRLDDAFRSVKL